MLGSKEIFVQS